MQKRGEKRKAIRRVNRGAAETAETARQGIRVKECSPQRARRAQSKAKNCAEGMEDAEFAEKNDPRAQSGVAVARGKGARFGKRPLQRQEEPKTQAHTPCLGHPAEYAEVHREKYSPQRTQRKATEARGTQDPGTYSVPGAPGGVR